MSINVVSIHDSIVRQTEIQPQKRVIPQRMLHELFFDEENTARSRSTILRMLSAGAEIEPGPFRLTGDGMRLVKRYSE